MPVSVRLDKEIEELLDKASRLLRTSKSEVIKMNKYHDLPMDFADASLVAVAERENTSTIFTLDYKDFEFY